MDSRWHETPVIAQIARAGPRHAHFPRVLVLVLAVFSAVSCIAGGMLLVIWHRGDHMLLPLEALRFTPFHDYLVPGLMLTLVVGGAQLVCVMATYGRTRLSPLVWGLAGGVLSGWIIAQAAMLRSFNTLHGLYLGIGVTLVVIGVRSTWQHEDPGSRWILTVTAGELLGFAVPAATGVLVTQLEVSAAVEVAALGAAGAVEGLLLGAAQAWAWPLPVRKLRYALLTAFAAALVWVCAMSLVQLVASDRASDQIVGVSVGATILLGLNPIGFAQWLELRHHVTRAWRFIAWTALAWLLALPFSFAPSPFVDESTPFVPQLALWSMGGVLMAFVMALVTWLGVRQLTRSEIGNGSDGIDPRARHQTLDPTS